MMNICCVELVKNKSLGCPAEGKVLLKNSLTFIAEMFTEFCWIHVFSLQHFNFCYFQIPCFHFHITVFKQILKPDPQSRTFLKPDFREILNNCPRRGPLHSLSEPTNNNKQMRNIVRFFSRISGGPGDGPQIVRFFPGFPGVPAVGARTGLRLRGFFQDFRRWGLG